MKNVKYLIALIMAFSSLASTFAQERELNVNGRVSDEQGTLPGVIVHIKGTQKYVFTGNDGEFSIGVPSENSILVFSMLGMVSQEITVDNQTFFEVYMEEIILDDNDGSNTQRKWQLPIRKLSD